MCNGKKDLEKDIGKQRIFIKEHVLIMLKKICQKIQIEHFRLTVAHYSSPQSFGVMGEPFT